MLRWHVTAVGMCRILLCRTLYSSLPDNNWIHYWWWYLDNTLLFLQIQKFSLHIIIFNSKPLKYFHSPRKQFAYSSRHLLIESSRHLLNLWWMGGVTPPTLPSSYAPVCMYHISPPKFPSNTISNYFSVTNQFWTMSTISLTPIWRTSLGSIEEILLTIEFIVVFTLFRLLGKSQMEMKKILK
jgi:hypothetical protein